MVKHSAQDWQQLRDAVWLALSDRIDALQASNLPINEHRELERMRRHIHKLGLQGRRRHKAVDVLATYIRTADRDLALRTVEVTLARRLSRCRETGAA